MRISDWSSDVCSSDLAIACTLGLASVCVTGAMLGLPGTPAKAQISVFDPSNYAQNILTAARTLSQVNQQIRQLQNEARMLVNMDKNLSRIDFPQLGVIREKLKIGRASCRERVCQYV